MIKLKNKYLLREYVHKILISILKEEKETIQNAEKANFIINRFPQLNKLFIDLMSPAYGRFIANIKIMAPKPTIFRVELVNGQYFEISYLGQSKFALKILGKKYFPSDLAELERASKAISNLLVLSKSDPNEAANKQKEFDQGLANDMGNSGGGSFSGGSFPGAEQPGGELPTGEPEIPKATEPLTADSDIPDNEDEKEPQQ